MGKIIALPDYVEDSLIENNDDYFISIFNELF